MSSAARILAASLAAALAAAAPPADAHDVVDPERLQAAVAEVARAQAAARATADPEALYDLGERIEAVVELLDGDAFAHGEPGVLGVLVAERLRSSGVDLRYSAQERRWASDLAPFRAYLARAPDGRRAPGAAFRLLARDFHARTGTDPGSLVAADVRAVARGASDEERFLSRYPGDPRSAEVRFFLAVDYYRLARASPSPSRARYRQLGRAALEAVRAARPGSMEARTAEALLEDLARR